MTKIGFGLVGCGMISRIHASAIQKNSRAQLIGACSKTYSSTEKFCCEFPLVKPFACYEDMLKDNTINTVVICSPSGDHFSQAKQALLAGKNVLVEKPISIKLRDVDELIELAAMKNLVLSSISQSRFSDTAQAVKKAVENGDFGKMCSCQLMMRYNRTQAYYDSGSWRGTFEGDGGGVLMNQGIHGIDLMCYIMGKPASVMGYTKTLLRKIEVEDTVAAAVEFENGAIGVIDATSLSVPSMTKKFIFSGEKGTVILEDDTIVLWGLETPCPIQNSVSCAGSSSADPRGVKDVYHGREYENYISSILDSKKLLIDGHQARIPLSVILGVYESSKTGKKVLL